MPESILSSQTQKALYQLYDEGSAWGWQSQMSRSRMRYQWSGFKQWNGEEVEVAKGDYPSNRLEQLKAHLTDCLVADGVPAEQAKKLTAKYYNNADAEYRNAYSFGIDEQGHVQLKERGAIREYALPTFELEAQYNALETEVSSLKLGVKTPPPAALPTLDRRLAPGITEIHVINQANTNAHIARSVAQNEHLVDLPVVKSLVPPSMQSATEQSSLTQLSPAERIAQLSAAFQIKGGDDGFKRFAYAMSHFVSDGLHPNLPLTPINPMKSVFVQLSTLVEHLSFAETLPLDEAKYRETLSNLRQNNALQQMGLPKTYAEFKQACEILKPEILVHQTKHGMITPQKQQQQQQQSHPEDASHEAQLQQRNAELLTQQQTTQRVVMGLSTNEPSIDQRHPASANLTPHERLLAMLGTGKCLQTAPGGEDSLNAVLHDLRAQGDIHGLLDDPRIKAGVIAELKLNARPHLIFSAMNGTQDASDPSTKSLQSGPVTHHTRDLMQAVLAREVPLSAEEAQHFHGNLTWGAKEGCRLPAEEFRLVHAHPELLMTLTGASGGNHLRDLLYEAKTSGDGGMVKQIGLRMAESQQPYPTKSAVILPDGTRNQAIKTMLEFGHHDVAGRIADRHDLPWEHDLRKQISDARKQAVQEQIRQQPQQGSDAPRDPAHEAELRKSNARLLEQFELAQRQAMEAHAAQAGQTQHPQPTAHSSPPAGENFTHVNSQALAGVNASVGVGMGAYGLYQRVTGDHTVQDLQAGGVRAVAAVTATLGDVANIGLGFLDSTKSFFKGAVTAIAENGESLGGASKVLGTVAETAGKRIPLIAVAVGAVDTSAAIAAKDGHRAVRAASGTAGGLLGGLGGGVLGGILATATTAAVTGFLAGTIAPGPGNLIGGVAGGLVGLGFGIAGAIGGSYAFSEAADHFYGAQADLALKGTSSPAKPAIRDAPILMAAKQSTPKVDLGAHLSSDLLSQLHQAVTNPGAGARGHRTADNQIGLH